MFATRFCSTVFVARRAASSVGFVGLGNMGGPMAANLMKKGQAVTGFDVDSETMQRYRDDGMNPAGSPGDVAKGAGIVVTMLPSNPHVLEVYLGDGGLFDKAAPGTLFLDCSTIDPAVSKQVNTIANKKKFRFCDAPVSGGVPAATAGTLTFMCGADNDTDFADASSLLELMGAKIFRCGPVGTGEAAKLCNNMLLAIHMIGVGEAMTLAQRLGLEAKTITEIMSVSTSRCWSVDTYNPVPGVKDGVPSSNDYAGGFGSTLMTKDLGLAQAAATATQTPTPLGSAAHQIYRILCQQGLGGKDFSVVYKYLSELK